MRIDVNKDAFTCCELNCNNVEHQHEIDCAYTQIMRACMMQVPNVLGLGSVNKIGLYLDGMTMLLNFNLMQEIVTKFGEIIVNQGMVLNMRTCNYRRLDLNLL